MPDDSLIEDLREQIAQNRVLVIVGAGVSMGATGGAKVASWPGLLHDGVDRCVAVAGLDAARSKRWHEDIDSGHLDEMVTIAERIERSLGAPKSGEYRKWLRETVGRLTITDRGVLEALRDLGAPLATTNYDDLLTQVTGRRALPWTEHALVQRAVRGEEDAILYLHGHWERPESVVLGVSSYRDVTDDAHAQTMQQVFASTRTLLFVGCGDGLSDANFGALRAWMAERFAGSEYRHYRLCREAEVAAVRAAHPPEERILPLPYGAAHADLAPFLRGLRPVAASPSPSVPGPAPGASAPTLPPRPPRLYGRDAIVADLVAALLSDPPPPTPVLGGPGMGKTTVTLAALHHRDVAARFRDRRVFVRLDGATTGAAILMGIAEKLGLPPGPDPGARALAVLAEAPALLVLDNAETPWDADRAGTEEALAQLATLPGLALVASVRGAERPRGVGWRPTITIPALTAADSRRLFEAVAGRSFGEDPALIALLGLLDDVPLALDLMGNLAQSSEPADLLARWRSEHAAMLVAGDGRTRLDSFAVSCELSIKGPRMTDEARRLLSQLGLLPDGVARRDLDSLLPGAGPRAAATLRAVGLAFDDGDRLRVRAPLREHVAALHSPAAGDRERLIAFYVALACEGDKAGKQGGAEAIARLTPEVANLDVVLPLGLNGEEWCYVIQGSLGFGEFVRFSGFGAPRLLRQAADIARRRNDGLREAHCIMSLGGMVFARSAHGEASSRFEEALSLYRRVGDVQGEANCIRRLGDIALRRSAHGEAWSRYEEALPLYRHIGDILGEANCIRSLGDLALARSAHGEASSRFEEALPLYRRVGDVLGEANCIMSLGDIALRRSAHREAWTRYEEALPLYRCVGSVRGEANCIMGLGTIALRSSAQGEASSRFEEALPLYRRVGDVLGEANCIMSLGTIAMARSAYGEASSRFEKALPLYRRVGDVQGEANCIKSLGDIALWRSAHGEATSRFEEALPLYRRVGSVLGEANCIRSLGDLALARAAHGEASSRFEEALPLYRRVGDVLGEANCIMSLGTIAMARSAYGEATSRFEEALPLYHRVGDVLGEANCTQGLGDIALAQSDHVGARARFTEGLAFYERIARPYSIGNAHWRLARVAETAADRRTHLEAARAAFRSIDRDDLIAELDGEFPPSD